MAWLYYPSFFYSAALLWMAAIGMLFAPRQSRLTRLGVVLGVAGTLVVMVFATLLWAALGRPPMRTLGETRLWYAIFVPAIGLIGMWRWKFRWFLQYALVLALVFLTINLIRPETHEKTLMPALQSPWFVPHVVVYIFAYALLAVSSLVAIKGLYQMWLCTYQPSVLAMADTLTRYGFAFLTLGLVFGALWAKEAWGDYWTWDPKETWALLTWMTYLVYIHLRYHRPHMHKAALVILALSFVVLLVCWFGLNYLPTAQNSVHTYTQ